MNERKLLIDTNVLIGLEDWRELQPALGKLQQLCSQYGQRLFVHEHATKDIARDRNLERRRITVSKLRKFERLAPAPMPSWSQLEISYGKISSDNDRVDIALLHSLHLGAVDFLVTEDQGIHSRARRVSPAFAARVLTIADAVEWLSAQFEPKSVHLPLIGEVPAHAVPLDDDFFVSLVADYPEFMTWWKTKCVPDHRPCWTLTIEGELAGLVVRKDETHAEARTVHRGPKILKLCTFKVKAKFRGEKLGEHLLKQALWYAQRNGYDLVYLTTFPIQQTLISVLDYFGFQRTTTDERGETTYEKPLSAAALRADSTDNLYEVSRLHYPRFLARPPAQSFCIPIRGEYHETLFPELAEPSLFGPTGTRTPGNTIRKVYLCRAASNQIDPGSVLYFYRSKDNSSLSQTLTTVGVAEKVFLATDVDELVRMTAKRSAYTTTQLARFFAQDPRPVKVIDFLLIGHMASPMTLPDLTSSGVFNRSPPQSISKIADRALPPIWERLGFGFHV